MRHEVCDSFPQSLDRLVEILGARKFSLDEHYIVLTPDRYTLHAETALFKGGGAIDCEVLTVSRLIGRVGAGARSLSREGGVMLAARAIAAVKDKLEYYKRAARYTDFARDVYETILQIASSDADADALAQTATGVTASKFRDLALIKTEYDRLKEQSLDSTDRLAALIAAAPSSALIHGSHFYAVGYSNVTRLNEQVFDAIAKNARSFSRLDANELTAPHAPPEVCRMPDAITQYKDVASRIREYVFKGGRYGDVAIVCPKPRALARILREYGIKFYADESSVLAETPPLAALALIYKLKSAQSAEDVVALAKNPFSRCVAIDAEKLQVYLENHGLRYGIFDCDIKDEDASRALACVKSLVGRFVGDTFSDACENAMEAGEFERTASELFQDVSDMLSPIHTLTELLRRYGAGEFASDADAFFSAARAVEVKSLPRKRDRVTVTSARALRMTRCKLLFVVDFIDGVLPEVTADTGLISDAEIKNTGNVIEPTVVERNRRDACELTAVICNAERVVCMYHTSGGARISPLLFEHAPKCKDEKGNVVIRERVYEAECAALKDSDDVSLIARYACATSAARELVARRMTKHAASIEAALADKPSKTAATFVPSIVSTPRGTLSVSELTHYFHCPYKRFLTDVVGVAERRAIGLTAPDFGIIVHDFMQRFVSERPLDCSRERVSDMIDEIIAAKQLAVGASDRTRLVDNAVDYARHNKAIIEAGRYEPRLLEYAFDGEITLGKAQTRFIGRIDRVDRCGDRVRIIDYKTGTSKTFSVGECLNGCDMQLPLYAAVLGAENVTGMFYVRLAPYYDSGDGRMSGCMVKDIDIATEYDGKLALGEPSSVVAAKFKFDKAGNPSFSNPSSNLMDKEIFTALIDRCVKTASVAADEIASGYIERTPTGDACKRCAYRGVCGDDVKVRNE